VEGNGAAIAAEAEQEISRVNLLYELYNPGQNALLSLGEHYFFTEGRGRNYFLSVAATIQTERGSSRVLEQEDGKKITEIIWTVPVVTVVPYAAAHRKLCRDPDLETVVAAFLHHPEDWTQIAKVLELVEVRCGGEIPRNWVSRTELELLRRTANSFAEAGRTGRHALPRYRAPDHPMLPRDAQQIARDILHKWLAIV
jgi:hypothetical protein